MSTPGLLSSQDPAVRATVDNQRCLHHWVPSMGC